MKKEIMTIAQMEIRLAFLKKSLALLITHRDDAKMNDDDTYEMYTEMCNNATDELLYLEGKLG